ncbi:hypothetical protein PGT21_014279 [Puccinia graminis f. sp. tritici]|uniref:Uncharacterized protein n=1 Tax=Puccinia graminis f. sp. tritici TaxID=56615 RepID=A0A5B0SFQ4_PUCGR|nr:hypothetical protein PGT21_014279 [Puccinia graminis f. sp. tritici]KAA1136073.1 hypothetical protein PGTUg99_026729 [Puccinia graminis f. sp. tritici]
MEMDSDKQDPSDLNELENQAKVDRGHRTGRSSAEPIIDHSIPKPQKEIVIGEKPSSDSEALVVENDSTSTRSQKDGTMKGKQVQWWPSLFK